MEARWWKKEGRWKSHCCLLTELECDEGPYDQAYVGADPLALLLERERAAAVAAALARLSEENQDIMRLLLKGVPQGEIADRLGMKAGTLRERLRSIRAQVRRILQEGPP